MRVRSDIQADKCYACFPCHAPSVSIPYRRSLGSDIARSYAVLRRFSRLFSLILESTLSRSDRKIAILSIPIFRRGT